MRLSVDINSINPVKDEGAPLTGTQSLLTEVKRVVANREDFHRCVYLLSQFVRCGFEPGTEKVTSSPELLHMRVRELLPQFGYSSSEKDPAVWVNPNTKEDGWIIELPTGKSLWEGPYIVAGFPQGATSRDLNRVIKRARDQVFEEYCDVIKQCSGVMSDQLVLRYQSPWFELKKEICHFQDVAGFFAKYPQHESYFAALFSFSQQSSESLMR